MDLSAILQNSSLISLFFWLIRILANRCFRYVDDSTLASVVDTTHSEIAGNRVFASLMPAITYGDLASMPKS
jgi:hypothetical protein